MTLEEIKTKRTKLLRDAQAVLLGEGVDGEKRAKAQLMITDADGCEADIASLERIAKFESEERARTTPPRPQPNGGMPSTEETAEQRTAKQKEAFSNYIRFGRVSEENRSHLTAGSLAGANLPAELRDLTTGVGGVGSVGYWIPQGFYPSLVEAEKSVGQIISLINVQKVSDGSPTKVGLVDDTANSLTVLGETVAVSEVDPTTSGKIVTPDMLTTGAVKVSIQSLQDSYFSVDEFLKNAFGVRYYRGLSNLVTNGSSSGNIQSILTGAHNVDTTTGPGVVGYSDIVNLFASLDPAYLGNSTFVMNSTTRGYLLGVTDTLGRPLFITSPNSGAFDTLLGRPVVLNQSMPNIGAGNTAIQFGDFKAGYLLRQVGDLTVLRLSERYMDQLEVGFIGYVRAGGVSLDMTNAHPIVNSIGHA
jgi:HK97 family phage major capsid protein